MNETGSSSQRSARAWWCRALLCLALAVFAFASHAQPGTEKRMALVIGNARYPQMSLTNPENDARVVASTLRRLGFDVTERVNLGVKEFRKVLRDYARRVENEEGASVFYYAGHGVQIEGRNYLLPVDINLRDEYEIRDEGVDIDELYIGRLERARSQVRIVILDACRDNPFTTKSRAVRGAGGLAEMAARGALIAYATAPGSTAEDGPPGTNSVFTRHLAKEMLTEGVEVEQMFKNVRVKVMRDTHERQVPWVNTSMTRNFSFNPAHGSSGDDEAKREDLARLQALLDQREREQKRLEEQLQQLSKRLADTQNAAVSQPPPAQAAVKPPSPNVPALAPAPAATAALRPDRPTQPPVSLPESLPVPDRPPSTLTAKQTAPPAASARDQTGGTDTAVSPQAYEAAKAWMARRRSETDTATATATAAVPASTAVKTAQPPLPPRPQPPSEDSAQLAYSTRPSGGVLPVAERAGRSGSGSGSERCVAVLIRAQLGEAIPPADMAFLKKECH